MRAQHHANGRIDDFRRRALEVHIHEARFGVVTAAADFLEFGGVGVMLFFNHRHAGAVEQPDRHGARHALHHKNILAAIGPHQTRRIVTVFRFDKIDIAIWRLDNMAVGGNHAFEKHGFLPDQVFESVIIVIDARLSHLKRIVRD